MLCSGNENLTKGLCLPYSPCASGHVRKGFINVNGFDPHCYYPHFTDEEIEAQGD